MSHCDPPSNVSGRGNDHSALRSTALRRIRVAEKCGYANAGTEGTFPPDCLKYINFCT